MERAQGYQIAAAVLTIGLLAAACGQSERDRPEDCRPSEFFNESNNRCESCPALSAPECPVGCGYEIFERENGCPDARCAPECRTCEVGRRYSSERGLCEPCPGVPDCEAFDCEGSLRVEGSYLGACPKSGQFACGDCTRPERGCTTGAEGQCVDIVEKDGG